MKCALCQTELPKDSLRCSSCRHWNFGDESDNEDTVLLSDARLEETVRLDLGWLNPIFGKNHKDDVGGLAKTSVNLIAGPPGAGKTTLFLQLSDLIADIADLYWPNENREIIYIASEQQAQEIKTTAKRIQIKNASRIRIVKAMGGLKRNLWDYFRQFKPCLIIVDSLTALCADNLALQVTVAQQIKQGTLELQCPSLLVNQVTKDEDHAGLMQLQHAVDALYMLDKDDATRERALFSKKNRFGESPKLLLMEMTSEDSEIPGKLIPKSQDSEEDDG